MTCSPLLPRSSIAVRPRASALILPMASVPAAFSRGCALRGGGWRECWTSPAPILNFSFLKFFFIFFYFLFFFWFSFICLHGFVYNLWMDGSKPPDEILRNTAHHLMDGTNIWYDLVPNDHGDLVDGPEKQAVLLLCRMASDLRLELRAQAGGEAASA